MAIQRVSKPKPKLYSHKTIRMIEYDILARKAVMDEDIRRLKARQQREVRQLEAQHMQDIAPLLEQLRALDRLIRVK